MFLCLGNSAKSVKTGVNSVHLSQQFCVARHCHFEGLAAPCEGHTLRMCAFSVPVIYGTAQSKWLFQ
jgi:hypothetical protein